MPVALGAAANVIQCCHPMDCGSVNLWCADYLSGRGVRCMICKQGVLPRGGTGCPDGLRLSYRNGNVPGRLPPCHRNSFCMSVHESLLAPANNLVPIFDRKNPLYR